MGKLIAIILIIFAAYKCTGGNYGTDKIFGAPDTLPLSRYEDIYVSTYFYFPNDKEVYLGDTKGASSCGDMAYSYAYEKGLHHSSNWSYICCTHEEGSNCYRTIR